MKCKVARFAALALLAAVSSGWVNAQSALVSLVPDADAFVRSQVPSANYGAAGALSVSGAAAVNAVGTQNGLFNTLLRFPSSNVVAAAANLLGSQPWVITSVQVTLTEMAAPDNAIFNRGVGAFQILRLATNAWVEGTGRPNAPTTDGVAWQDLAGLLQPNQDYSLGTFTNRGLDGPLSFPLPLETRLVSDLKAGNEVSLLLLDADPEIGFTFNSRDFGNTNARPVLEVVIQADPQPQIASISSDGTQVTIRFATASNWNYTVQWSSATTGGGIAAWTDLATVPAEPTSGNATVQDPAANSTRFYRLVASP